MFTKLAEAVDVDTQAKLHALSVQNAERLEHEKEAERDAATRKLICYLEAHFKRNPDPQYIQIFGLEHWIEDRLFFQYSFLAVGKPNLYYVKRLS